MNHLNEFNQFYKTGDIVLIEYWYNSMVTPVIIKDKTKNKYMISHKVEGSKIQNAPDEWISSSDILDKYI